MTDNIYSFDKDFEPEDFEDVQRRFRDHEDRKETMKKHPAGKKTTTQRVSDEASAYIGLVVLEFLFLTVPLALLLAGLVVVPVTEAIFNVEIGFWTAFLLLMTIRWLIPRPRKRVLFRKGR